MLPLRMLTTTTTLVVEKAEVTTEVTTEEIGPTRMLLALATTLATILVDRVTKRKRLSTRRRSQR